MFVMVLTVSLTIPYLGAERFGVWMTIASFVGMLSFLDLGVGNALTNKVSQVAAQNNPEALRCTISGGLGFLFILGGAISLLLFGLTSILPWNKIIKVKELTEGTEVLNAVVVFSILFGVSLLTNGIQRIFAGLQRAFEAHFANLAGSCFSIFMLWIVTRKEASIPYLLAATLGVQLIFNMGLLFVLAKRSLFTFKHIAAHTRLEARHLLHVGGLFFILQIGTMVGWGADSLIIASTLGATHVATFNIVQRLYQFISQPVNIINAPLWGAYADAHARGEHLFILRTLKKSILLTATFATTGGIILFVMSQQLIEWWTKGNLSVSPGFVFMFFVWTICESLGNTFSMMMNGCGIVREQVVTVLLLSAIALPTKLVVINYFGITEMLASYTAIYCLVVLFLYGIYYRKTIIEKVSL